MQAYRYGTEYNCAKTDAILPAEYINNLILTPETAESMAIPDGARFMIVSSNEDVWLRFSGTAEIPTSDVTDGTGNMLISAGSYGRRTFYVEQSTGGVSVISAVAAQVSFEFFA